MLVKINSDNPQMRLIQRAVGILKRGGTIIYPTDTTYGIGCDLSNKKAIENLYTMRWQEKGKPLSLICSDLDHLSQYAKNVSNYAYKTMHRLLPGPYTFVLQASKQVPKMLLTKQKTVGIRIPDCNICRLIVEELGNPLVNTSVYSSRYEETLLNDPVDIAERFGNAVDMIIDGGVLTAQLSSVVDLSEDVPRVLRVGQGDVSYFTTQG